MGEAKQRGTFEQRKQLALLKKIKKFTDMSFDFSDPETIYLRQGYEFLKKNIHPLDWNQRRQAIIEYLNRRPDEYKNPDSRVRYTKDEIGWYLFLCEEFFKNPATTEYAQLSRIAPFIACIGRRLDSINNIKDIGKKLKDLVKKYKNNPDGLLYEILVASSYLEQGFTVEFIEENQSNQTPDLRITKNNEEYYIECKKLNRRTEYAEKEKVYFLEAWKNSQEILLRNFKNFWLQIEVKIDLINIGLKSFTEKFEKVVIKNDFALYEDDEIKIIGKRKNLNLINEYLDHNYVKLNSYVLSKLLGENLVSINCERTHILFVESSIMIGSVAPVLGQYVEKVNGFVGATRIFTNASSLEKKSREITRHVKEALEQLSGYRPCIVHVMFEALESNEVEELRFKKIQEKMEDLILELEPNISIKMNRIQNLQTPNMLFDILETTKIWGRDFGLNTFDIIPNKNPL